MLKPTKLNQGNFLTVADNRRFYSADRNMCSIHCICAVVLLSDCAQGGKRPHAV